MASRDEFLQVLLDGGGPAGKQSEDDPRLQSPTARDRILRAMMGLPALPALADFWKGSTEGVLDTVATPGRAMEEGTTTEEAVPWGAGTAMNIVGAGVPFAKPGTLGMAGGKPPRSRPPPMGHNNPPPEYRMFPEYAEVYPPMGPGTPGVGERGNAYFSRQLTPEAEEFKAVRARHMADMKKSGFVPYFDPAKREYTDPTHYPPNVNTLNVLPSGRGKGEVKVASQQKTIASLLEKYGGEKALTERLEAGYRRGAQSPDAFDWYAMKQLEDEFIKEYGAVEGRKQFQNKFATGMASTTSGQDPTGNLIMSQYGNYLRAHNMPYPETGANMPFPTSGQYMGTNIQAHKDIFDRGGFSALDESQPKQHDFSQALTGNRNVSVMDKQMVGGMGPQQMVKGKMKPVLDQGAPPGQYGIFAGVAHNLAKKLGVMPANIQDVAWAGFKNSPGKPMIQHVNEAIERTHRLTGMPREEIVRRGLVRGEIPIYGISGLATLPALVPGEGDSR